MQMAHDFYAAATTAIQSKAGSLRHFSRFGAIVIGVAAGVVTLSNQGSVREAAFRSAISARDAEIAELKSARETLEMEKSGQTAKPSSGDPVQDWIDSLA